MLTETQWNQLDEIFHKNGLGVRMLSADAYIVTDAYNYRCSQETYTTHEAAALALIGNTYKPLTPRLETCVQHGARNQPQRRAERGQGVGNPVLGGARCCYNSPPNISAPVWG